MKTGEIVLITAAVILGVFYGLPALMERRGSLWKDMAEERDAALKEYQQELKNKDQELKDSQQKIRDLELRTDLSSLQKDVSDGREAAVLLVKAEIAAVQKSIVETEERILASYESHETRAQERHEKVVKAFEAIAEKIK